MRSMMHAAHTTPELMRALREVLIEPEREDQKMLRCAVVLPALGLTPEPAGSDMPSKSASVQSARNVAGAAADGMPFSTSKIGLRQRLRAARNDAPMNADPRQSPDTI